MLYFSYTIDSGYIKLGLEPIVLELVLLLKEPEISLGYWLSDPSEPTKDGGFGVQLAIGGARHYETLISSLHDEDGVLVITATLDSFLKGLKNSSPRFYQKLVNDEETAFLNKLKELGVNPWE